MDLPCPTRPVEPPPPSCAGDLGSFAPDSTPDLAAGPSETLERMGAYRVLREIGRGGMGTVYLAVRDDDQFQKQAAIKVVKRGMDTGEVLSRFRQERQILANLDHPYVARLLDAGATSDGRPYFVMEYIAGEPVDVFCREQKLGVEARCRLFLKICEAVAYAHRNLVVHRDLKPGNIFVNAEGEPKLLDFGVAKLLTGDECPANTAVFSRPFTPAYASPEQVQGLPPATTADVYSLGAVLYEMLTGERALTLSDSATPAEIEAAICLTETVRPSARVRGLDADLDNIVLMAMRKDPARRYQSAADLAMDVQRYLDRRPVTARPDSAWYRGRRFGRRHWIALSTAMLVAASLIAGTVMALRETAVARRELEKAEAETRRIDAARASEAESRSMAEQQRGEADQQRALAERRLNDLLEMANRALFNVHDSIASLSGGTAARRDLVKTTLEYLQSIEKTNGLDRRMRLALSAGYEKIGLVQGDPYGPSLQDFRGGEASLKKAEELLQPVYAASPNDPDVLMRWVAIHAALADLTFQNKSYEPAAKALLTLLPAARRLGQLRPLDPTAAAQEAEVEGKLSVVLRYGSLADDILHATRQVVLLRALVRRFPADLNIQTNLGTALASLALAVSHQGDLEGASAYYLESIAMREKLLEVAPQTPGLRRNLMVAYGNYASLLGMPWSVNLGRFQEARTYAAKAVATAREMVKADPENATAKSDLGMGLSRLGMIAPDPDGLAESLAHLQESIAILEPIARANAQSPNIQGSLAFVRIYAGYRLEALRQPGPAAAQYRQALAEVEPMLGTIGSATLYTMLARDALALLSASAGDGGAALEFANSAVACAEKYYGPAVNNEAQTAYRAEAYFKLALVQKSRNDWPAARAAAEKALLLWAPIKNPEVSGLHKPQADTARSLVQESAAHTAQ